MHEQIAFRTAYAVTGNAADAEEVAQDAFVKAYRALGRFRRLLRIVGNEARNRVRARGRRDRVVERVATDPVVSGGAAPPPEADVLEEERRHELFEALGRLRPEERLAIFGRFYLGLTDEEAAAALGVRRSAVKMRVFRALERLRADLEVGS
jgi:RNA polymerase sigma-70 factor (ECF subfamily)